MNFKNFSASAAAAIVAGVVIAGQTLGWRTFISSSWFARISVSPASRTPDAKDFFADEKLWVTLSEKETDHVYWVFDESSNVILGGVQLQYAFPFDPQKPIGVESSRRIDAFYKSGDGYRDVSTYVRVLNTQIRANATVGPNGLALSLQKELPGNWKLDTIDLAKLRDGKFQNLKIEPASSASTSAATEVMWNDASIASGFGYPTSKEAGAKLLLDTTAWVSAEYKGDKPGERLTVVKRLAPEAKK